jgi:hypothetical protein
MIVVPCGGQLNFIDRRAAKRDTVLCAFFNLSGDFLPIGGRWRADTLDDVAGKLAKAPHQWFLLAGHHDDNRSIT